LYLDLLFSEITYYPGNGSEEILLPPNNYLAIYSKNFKLSTVYVFQVGMTRRVIRADDPTDPKLEILFILFILSKSKDIWIVISIANLFILFSTKSF